MAYKKTSDFQNQVFSITRQKRVRQGKEKLHKEESSSCVFSNLSMSQLGKLRKDRVQWEGDQPKRMLRWTQIGARSEFITNLCQILILNGPSFNLFLSA